MPAPLQLDDSLPAAVQPAAGIKQRGTEVLRFGPAGRFELQALERRLLVDGAPASLGARAFDLLIEMAARPGELRTKNELIEAVWPGLVVEEGNLATQISTLRKVLGPECIATIPGRGYRFTAALVVADDGPAPAPAAPASTASAAPAASPSAPAASLLTHLPAALPTLLGRDDDLASITNMLSVHRLVTIVGPGGMGKTLLTQHLLAAHRTAYPHGVCWIAVPLALPADDLPGHIAAALGVNPGLGDPLVGLCAALAPLAMLVALDNAEHLVDATAAVARALHEAAPGVRLLVTSQVPLRLAAEHVYRLGPLSVPDAPLPAADTRTHGAVALFLDRAQAADARFTLSDAQLPAVIELCRRLDGLPLAIELAAARAPMLGVPKLLAALNDRLRLLTGGRNRTAPARHQTLRATLEWSHALLDERERIVFRRLAVFAGSATLAIIQQTLSDTEGTLDEWAVLDALTVLADRSLLAPVAVDDEAAEPRYRLLDSPRVYALERLREAGEDHALRGRHAQAMAELAQRYWDEQFEGRARVDDCERRLTPDLENFREAVAWCHAAGQAGPVLRIGATLLWTVPRSVHREGLTLCDLCEPLLDTVDDTALRLRAGWTIAQRLADVQRERSLALSRTLVAQTAQLGPSPAQRRLAFLAHCRLAIAASRSLEREDAFAALQQVQALEDPSWPALVLSFGADARHWVASDQGQHATALRALDDYLRLLRRAGAAEGLALANRVDAELAAGDAAAAARTGARVVALLQAGRDEYSLSLARVNLAAACLAINDLAQAREVLQAGWSGAPLFDDAPYFADYLALFAALEGRCHSAARILGWADAANAELGPREPNEQAAVERAAALARELLGHTAFDRLRAEGTRLALADVGWLAFEAVEVAAAA